MRGKTCVSYLLRSQNLNGTVSAITNVNNKNEKRLGEWRKADGFQGEWKNKWHREIGYNF